MVGNSKFRFSFLVLLAFSLANCGDDESPTPPHMDFISDQKKVIVLNEGNIGSNGASISMLDIPSDVMTNQVFENKNNRLLGDFAQNIHFDSDKAYITVSNSNKVEIVNEEDFSSVQTIQNLIAPDDVLVISSNDLFVSHLGEENLNIVNISNGFVTRTIELDCTQPVDELEKCGNGELLLSGNLIYIANKGIRSLMRTTKIGADIGDEDLINLSGTPKDMLIDKDGMFWIMTFDNNSLYRIDPLEFKVIYQASIGTFSRQSVNMSINEEGDRLYFNEGDISSMGIYDIWESRTTFYENTEDVTFYSFAIDETAAFLYAGIKGENDGPGELRKVRLSTGIEMARHTVGVAPSKLYFR